MEQGDVIISGGGLVGLTLALALDQAGLKSFVVEAMDPAQSLAKGFDGRASAISSSSWRMLEALGVADDLRDHTAPIRRIEVRDGVQRDCLDFTIGADDEPLGHMLENSILRSALHDHAARAKNVRLFMPNRAVKTERDDVSARVTLDDGTDLVAPLLLAAEGRKSATREAAGLNTAHWDYNHTAIISAFDHAIPHDNIAHEIFYPAGPFALLPLPPGTRSALVWTVATKDAAAVLALSEAAFHGEVKKRAGGLLGEINSIAPRSSYPLNFHHAAHVTATRLALIGDSAHGMHPIAGQGLNLGFRDVAAMAEVLIDGARLGLDLGDQQLLKRYEAWRSVDSLSVMAATDGLNRLFGIPGKTARSVRRFGLGLVQRTSPIKAFFMNEARGTSGDLPRLLQGMPV
jgi:2-octaprenyl-6-methoxyphenol hydroxylase